MTPFNPAFNVAVNHIASKLFPAGFDVGPAAPSTLDELRRHVETTGRFLVWDGASDQTIFACPSTNHAFRAWHDWCHWRYSLPFTLAGEKHAALRQCDHVNALYGARDAAAFRRLIWAEVVGQAEHLATHGEFPTDQRAFVRAYLARLP